MNNDDSAENDNENSACEVSEQLLKANERLQAQLLVAQQQLASLSALSASLVPPAQAGDALVPFGEGTARRWLNARSIRMLSLSEGMILDFSSGNSPAQPSGTFAVVADELQVTGYLEPDEAEQVLDQWAEALNLAMQPPKPW